jgi:CRISP-associated protein Cas1
VLQHPGIHLSAAAVIELLAAGAVIIFCDEKRLPSGILLPVSQHSQTASRMSNQIDAGAPARKNAWKLIIRAKILAQAGEVNTPAKDKLLRLAQKVKSGDPENLEAQAGRVYWSARFPTQYKKGERRDPSSESNFNVLLNYGYSILRAATARAIVAGGLQPTLGVFHHRRDNAYCLADDLMEPMRPLVDRIVGEILTQADEPVCAALNSTNRRALLDVLSRRVEFGGSSGPLMAVLPRYVTNFYAVLTRQQNKLLFPVF